MSLPTITEAEKPLWEKLYDFYNDNKTTITILSFIRTIGYG